jgi:DNA polymerase-3 subunit delta'
MAKRPTAAVAGPAIPPVFDRLATQPRVREFLGDAVRENRLGQAYLFLGAPGSGKRAAAEALAAAAVCPNGGCGSCDECIRVAHGTHPDVRRLSPESATGYLVGQVRELIDTVGLAPVRASRKVYIVDRAELLRASSANALLKTLEEPPDDVMFILLGRTADAILPTIVSRCQVVPFRVLPIEAARTEVKRECGVEGTDADVAIAVAGTPDRAVDFLASQGRRHVRDLVVRTIGELARDDSWDVLVSAREICAAVKAPLADVRSAQQAVLDESSDYLSRQAMKQLEDRNKRELSAQERSGMMEALAAAESLLRDVLLSCEGVDEPIVNADASDLVSTLSANATTTGVLAALGALAKARDDLSHNVSPQLAVEVMLLAIKEAL